MAWLTGVIKSNQSQFIKRMNLQAVNLTLNGIKGFWGLTKTRLVKFKGIHRHTFYLPLKEGEFRYNHRKENIYKLLLKLVLKNLLLLT